MGRRAMRELIRMSAAAWIASSPASAYDPPYVWVGQMVLLELDQCGGGGSQTVAIVLRPKLQAGEDNSTLTYQFGFASGTVRKTAPSPQLNGSGAYAGSFVTGYASTRTNQGRFDLSVTPTRITPATEFVTLTGRFTNFAGVDGCTVKVRGAASRLPRT